MSDDQRSVVILGEALLDVFAPDAEIIGGAPFNVARNLAALGLPTLMVSRVGQDARGNRIAAEFERYGLSTVGLQRDALRPTGVVHVHMDPHGQHRFEIGADCAWDALDTPAALATVQSMQAPAFIYFGTLAQRSSVSRAAIHACLAATSAQRFLDLNLRNDPQDHTLAAESLALADIVKLNADELDQLRRWWGHSPEALAKLYGLQHLIVTRGAQGWACFDAATGEWLEGPAPPVQTIADTVGAGDAYAAVVLLGLARGWPMALSLQRAAEFSARVCMMHGAVDAASGMYAEVRNAWSDPLLQATSVRYARDPRHFGL